MLTGSVAGGFTAFFTTPLDVIKTRLMLQGGKEHSKYKGISHTFSTIVKVGYSYATFITASS
jgi:solute carrier family 25 aspartate/glutamate transporter 12/13